MYRLWKIVRIIQIIRLMLVFFRPAWTKFSEQRPRIEMKEHVRTVLTVLRLSWVVTLVDIVLEKVIPNKQWSWSADNSASDHNHSGWPRQAAKTITCQKKNRYRINSQHTWEFGPSKRLVIHELTRSRSKCWYHRVFQPSSAVNVNNSHTINGTSRPRSKASRDHLYLWVRVGDKWETRSWRKIKMFQAQPKYFWLINRRAVPYQKLEPMTLACAWYKIE